MYTTVQQYLSQYKNVNLRTEIKVVVQKISTKMEEKYNNSTTMCISVQKYKFQYKNKSFGTEKYFFKNLEKIGRYFIHDYYYVPKYMLIIVYLNKPYVFHYYKLSRLYSTKHHLTPLYHTIHPFTSYILPCIIPCTSIHHHIPLFITIHLYKSPYTSV